jgi:DNA invertase Pin-like site-specific DNA recombinase
MIKLYVQYVRVSTYKGESQKYSADIQKKAMDDFVLKEGGKTIAVFEEYKSGGDRKRKEIQLAITLAQEKDAILLVSTLDRLARDMKFIYDVKDKVKFIATDNPEMSPLMLGILASFAEEERRLISERTKAGIQSVKLSGKKVGGNHWKEVPINLINSNKERGLKRREELKSFVLEWKTFIDGDPYKLIELLKKQGKTNHLGEPYNLRSLKRLGILDTLHENP